MVKETYNKYKKKEADRKIILIKEQQDRKEREAKCWAKAQAELDGLLGR